MGQANQSPDAGSRRSHLTLGAVLVAVLVLVVGVTRGPDDVLVTAAGASGALPTDVNGAQVSSAAATAAAETAVYFPARFPRRGTDPYPRFDDDGHPLPTEDEVQPATF